LTDIGSTDCIYLALAGYCADGTLIPTLANTYSLYATHANRMQCKADP